MPPPHVGPWSARFSRCSEAVGVAHHARCADPVEDNGAPPRQYRGTAMMRALRTTALPPISTCCKKRRAPVLRQTYLQDRGRPTSAARLTARPCVQRAMRRGPRPGLLRLSALACSPDSAQGRASVLVPGAVPHNSSCSNGSKGGRQAGKGKGYGGPERKSLHAHTANK